MEVFAPKWSHLKVQLLFALQLVENKNLFCRTTYSNEFYSIYEKENIFACQPHPEKSQKYGLELLKNFSKI